MRNWLQIKRNTAWSCTPPTPILNAWYAQRREFLKHHGGCMAKWRFHLGEAQRRNGTISVVIPVKITAVPQSFLTHNSGHWGTGAAQKFIMHLSSLIISPHWWVFLVVSWASIASEWELRRIWELEGRLRMLLITFGIKYSNTSSFLQMDLTCYHWTFQFP